MSVGPKTCAIAIVVVLLLAAVPLQPAVMAQETPTSGLEATTFEDGLSSRDIVFPGPGYNDQTSMVLPNHAFVDSATVNMTFGTFPGKRSAPWDPSLDVGADGDTEWAFDSDRGGPLGLQDRFSDGETFQDLSFINGGTREFFIRLPRDAKITEAYIDVEGFPIPHWVHQYELTPKTDSPGEYGPKMAEYDGQMWVIWESSDQNITTGGDSDVVVRMFDGKFWHGIIELSTPGDSDEDDIPQIIAFQDKLYAIWSRGDGRATAGGKSELVYRAWDGEEWSPIALISGAKEDGLNTYERCVVFNDHLYVVWKSTDPSYCNHAFNGRDLDIVYARYDGVKWSKPKEITASTNDAEDWSVDVVVYNGRLYVIWDTWETDVTVSLGNVDVVYKSYDEVGGWSSLRNLSPPEDKALAFGGVQDALPRFYTWFNPVTEEKELFAIWMRGRTILSNGDGYHIVYRRYTGSDWLPMVQLSFAGDEPIDQMFPSLVSFNGTLYAIWTLGTNTTSRPEGGTTLIATYGDIIIRSFDGAKWSPILELTPWGNGYDDASHPSIYIYDGKVFAAWETPLPNDHGSYSWEIVMRHLQIAPVTVRLEFGEGNPVVWGWERLSNTKQRVHFDPEALTESLNTMPYSMDRYLNKYTEFPFRISDEAAASVRLSNLTIRYEYEVSVDIAEEAEDVISGQRDNTHVDKDVPVVFKVSTGQSGRITLEDPHIVYHLDYPPLLLEDVPAQQVFEDEARDYLVNLHDYFTDDWDNESLRFVIINESEPHFVDAYLIDSWLSVKLPEKDWNGEITVQVRAHDRHPFYHNDSNVFIIRVLPVNDAPVLHFITDRELEVDVEHIEYLQASDPDVEDRNDLVFSDDSDHIEVDAVTGRMKVTFRSFDPRVIYFNVTVTDPQGANDSQEVRYNYTMTRVRIQEEDDFPYALIIMLLMILALVVAERMRRPYRMSDDEAIWDEEAAYEEMEEVRSTGQWWRRYF
jgi:hypothetical protein